MAKRIKIKIYRDSDNAVRLVCRGTTYPFGYAEPQELARISRMTADRETFEECWSGSFVSEESLKEQGYVRVFHEGLHFGGNYYA